MSDTSDKDVALGVATALADSIIRALPKARQARAAMNIKGHVLVIEDAEQESRASGAHSEVKEVLQAFFNLMASSAKD